jgi:hypothetical protein
VECGTVGAAGIAHITGIQWVDLLVFGDLRLVSQHHDKQNHEAEAQTQQRHNRCMRRQSQGKQ